MTAYHSIFASVVRAGIEASNGNETLVNQRLHLCNTVSHYLGDRGYRKAMVALNFAMQEHHFEVGHDGEVNVQSRRDKDPAFIHQLSQMYYTITLLKAGYRINKPQVLLAVNALHDIQEDKSVTRGEIVLRVSEKVARSNSLMNKTDLSDDEYYNNILCDDTASLAKGLDRIHNLATCVGGMTVEKQKKYLLETRKYILPMLETAKVFFPEQKRTFDAITQMLEAQMCRIEQYHYQLGERDYPVSGDEWVEPPENTVTDVIPFDVPELLHPTKMIEQRAEKDLGCPLEAPFRVAFSRTVKKAILFILQKPEVSQSEMPYLSL